MPYQHADAISKKWLPFEFVWRCEFCINVFWIDGSINPKELTQEKRIQIKETKMLYQAIMHLSFSDPLSITQIKNAQEDPGVLGMVIDFNSPNRKKEDDDDEST